MSWGTRWDATELNASAGTGWEFRGPDGELGWTVSRAESGPRQVFSSVRGPEAAPDGADLEAMTAYAVGDLLGGLDHVDEGGWIARDVSAGLLLAAVDVTGWQGEEWAVETTRDGTPVRWAGPSDGRTPYAWLRLVTAEGARVIGTYQDDAVFGLDLTSRLDPAPLARPQGSRRPRPDLALPRGPIRAVDLVLDTSVAGAAGPGVVTEAVLHGEEAALLLVAAEAYGTDEWHLHDQSVVVVTDPRLADELTWIPPRAPWPLAEQPQGRYSPVPRADEPASRRSPDR